MTSATNGTPVTIPANKEIQVGFSVDAGTNATAGGATVRVTVSGTV